MKRFAMEFFKRGTFICGIGPIILAVVYVALQHNADIQTLTVGEVCTGIVSLTLLAFVAGGMNAIYQIERIPLMVSILIHGCVLYISYLITYLVNGWLEWGILPILVFSGIFVVGYLAIWTVIYSIIRRNAAKINEKLKIQQERA